MKKVVLIENNILATNTIRFKLTDALVKHGYLITILTTGLPHELQQARDNGFKVIDIGTSNQHPADILRYLKNLRNNLKSISPDVCLTFTMRPAIWGNMITRILQIPTITNITGIGPLFEHKNFSYKAARKLYKYVLKKTAKVFFQNKDDMSLFLENKFISDSQTALIPGSGVDYEYYLPIPSVTIKNNFVFLFVGRLIRDKGIGEFVTAAAEIKKRYPEAKFQVLGPLWTQNLSSNTISAAELNTWQDDNIIEYLGEAKDIRSYLANADCVVLPSYREGMSNILLEAGSMEKPCISCDTTGCREIVEDGVTGYLCKVRDAADLAEKMIKMYNLPSDKRTEMGVEARKKIIRQFGKQIVIDAYISAIEQLL
ncbi:MAG: glycosyltransferase family 4 protein [Ferruginibacter sp.]